jgi:hypothetical protein
MNVASPIWSNCYCREYLADKGVQLRSGTCASDLIHPLSESTPKIVATHRHNKVAFGGSADRSVLGDSDEVLHLP